MVRMTPAVMTSTESTWEMVYLVWCYKIAAEIEKRKTHDLLDINHPISILITSPPLRKIICTGMGML